MFSHTFFILCYPPQKSVGETRHEMAEDSRKLQGIEHAVLRKPHALSTVWTGFLKIPSTTIDYTSNSNATITDMTLDLHSTFSQACVILHNDKWCRSIWVNVLYKYQPFIFFLWHMTWLWTNNLLFGTVKFKFYVILFIFTYYWSVCHVPGFSISFFGSIVIAMKHPWPCKISSNGYITQFTTENIHQIWSMFRDTASKTHFPSLSSRCSPETYCCHLWQPVSRYHVLRETDILCMKTHCNFCCQRLMIMPSQY